MTEPITILFAEDDPDDVLLAELALERSGAVVSVHVVRHRDEATAYLQGAPPFEDRVTHPPPRLLVLDLKLSGTTGFEVLAWVQEHPGLRPPIIAVLSGCEYPKDVERAYGLGADFYIFKMSDLERLGKKLKRLVRLSGVPIVILGAQKPPIQLREME